MKSGFDKKENLKPNASGIITLTYAYKSCVCLFMCVYIDVYMCVCITHTYLCIYNITIIIFKEASNYFRGNIGKGGIEGEMMYLISHLYP